MLKRSDADEVVAAAYLSVADDMDILANYHSAMGEHVVSNTLRNASENMRDIADFYDKFVHKKAVLARRALDNRRDIT